MGLIIVMVVGSVLGWLAAIVISRDDRVAAVICVSAGLAGALAGAVLSGDVPLVTGISARQLLWSVLGAMLTIAAINAVFGVVLGHRLEQ